MDKSILENNLNETISYQQFFTALGYEPEEKIYFRVFDDKKRVEYGKNSDTTLDNISRIIPTLKSRNADGWGVFFVVNGCGQSDAEVKKARAQFIDFDDFTFPEQIDKLNNFPLEPSIIVKTRKSLHCYWILENGEVKFFREVQQRLNQYFGSDSVIVNESRVMRLYGFDHMKQDPVTVKLIKFNPELKYNQRQFHECLPLLTASNTGKGSSVQIAKNTAGQVPIGQRNGYIVSKIGTFVNLLNGSADADAILALSWADAQQNCDTSDNDAEYTDFEKFSRKYKPEITRYINRQEEEKQDPDLYKRSMAAWRDEHPDEVFDSTTHSWDEVLEAGRRAKDKADERAQQIGYRSDAEWSDALAQWKASKHKPEPEAADVPPAGDPDALPEEYVILYKMFAKWYNAGKNDAVLSEREREWLVDDYCAYADDLNNMADFFRSECLLDNDGNLEIGSQYIIDTYTGQEPLAEAEPAQVEPVEPERPEPAEEPHKSQLDSFLDEIQTEKYKPYKTDLPFFDKLLGGGIIRQNLAIIMAAPGTGKTTLCQQIAEEIAKHKKPIVYLCLEMSGQQMLAKALSCKLYQNRVDMSALEILQGYNWTDEQREQVLAAAESYRQNIAPYVKYIQPKNTDIDSILENLGKLADRVTENGGEAPAVIVDYLHLIGTTKKIDQQELIKAVVTGFKNYAIKYNTFVIGISASNRESNKRGKMTLESGRDSSNLEYTGDIMLSMNYDELDRDLLDNDDDIEKLKNKKWKHIVLRLHKSRFTPAGRLARVHFNSRNNIFYGENEWMPADDERTPFDGPKQSKDNKRR